MAKPKVEMDWSHLKEALARSGGLVGRAGTGLDFSDLRGIPYINESVPNEYGDARDVGSRRTFPLLDPADDPLDPFD